MSCAPLHVSRHQGVDYPTALAWQQDALQQIASDSGSPEHLFLVEHIPTITLGRGAGEGTLLLSRDALAARGIEVHESRRGGDVTYHGPGQWTAYPLLRLGDRGRDLHRYMRNLEETVIQLLRGYNLEGFRRDGKTGVWINRGGAPAKIAAVGIAVSRWVSWHGVALNVDPDLAPFTDCMIPCGIPARDGGVTSLAHALDTRINMTDAARRWLTAFASVFDVEIQEQPTPRC